MLRHQPWIRTSPPSWLTCIPGFAQNLTDGIIRARYRQSTARPEPIEPGEVYAYTIDLWATSNVFKAGHRIRLEISSSNFPRFDRNPNTGGALATETALLPAIQTIHHDGVSLARDTTDYSTCVSCLARCAVPTSRAQATVYSAGVYRSRPRFAR